VNERIEKVRYQGSTGGRLAAWLDPAPVTSYSKRCSHMASSDRRRFAAATQITRGLLESRIGV
jgi:hypothetical protein